MSDKCISVSVYIYVKYVCIYIYINECIVFMYIYVQVH